MNLSNEKSSVAQDSLEILSKTILDNDLGKLAPRERTEYYLGVCRSLHLNPLTRPFELVRLNGRLTLYATKNATDQLRQIFRISIDNLESQVIGDTFNVSLRATTPDGRTDTDMASVSIKNLQGEALCNAMMKCITKAKRRLTLSICGLGGILDESEARTVPDAEFIEPGNTNPDGEIWRTWKEPADAIAWAETVLTNHSRADLELEFSQLDAPHGKKARAWCEHVLKIYDF